MSQYHLKVSDRYDLLIGGGYKLFVDGVVSNIAVSKRWNGSAWVRIYEWKTDRPVSAHYYDGNSWVNVSLR